MGETLGKVHRDTRTALPGSVPRPRMMQAGEDHKVSSRMMRCSEMGAAVSPAVTKLFRCYRKAWVGGRARRLRHQVLAQEVVTHTADM